MAKKPLNKKQQLQTVRESKKPSEKQKVIEYEEINQVKQILATRPNELWNYVRKKEPLSDQK